MCVCVCVYNYLLPCIHILIHDTIRRNIKDHPIVLDKWKLPRDK